MKPLRAFLDFLAKMGLTLRGDPPRKIRVEGLEWGPETEGIRVSIRQKNAGERGQPPEITVVMKNFGTRTWKLVVPGWMFFHTVETTATLNAFGSRLLGPQGRREHIEITLGPGDATGTDLPVGSLYQMSPGAEYPVRVSTKLPGEVVVLSNDILVRS